jgi:hypothetical protein
VELTVPSSRVLLFYVFNVAVVLAIGATIYVLGLIILILKIETSNSLQNSPVMFYSNKILKMTATFLGYVK